VLVFNPGSAVGKHPALCASYGILTVTDSIQGQIVRL